MYHLREDLDDIHLQSSFTLEMELSVSFILNNIFYKRYVVLINVIYHEGVSLLQ